MRSLVLSLILICSPVICYAWGQDGHRIVGRIADKNLTEPARQKISVLLQDDRLNNGKPSNRMSLESVSNWADEIKSTEAGKGKSAWHYRNNAVCQDREGPCENGDCVDKRINGMIEFLKAPGKPIAERNEALKWLVHLVGDIHQPLHSGDNQDRGGNDLKVALSGYRTRGQRSLHGVWDTELVKIAMEQGPIDAQLTKEFERGTPALWMADARQMAKTSVYSQLPNFACNTTPDQIIVLSKAYQATAANIVREQLKLAGLRLAAVLNDIYR